MTPAALQALLSGETDNFLAASTPSGIEAQEKAGQLAQASKATLPIDLHDRQAFIDAGFIIGPKVDDLFTEATFPAGWRKVPTDHSMWSNIVDAAGTVRGSIFYKAAFYDRSAFASLKAQGS